MTRRSSKAHSFTRSTKAGSYTHVLEESPSHWGAYRFTPWGIVNMCADRFRDGTAITRLVFPHAGRRYEREFVAFYGHQWAGRLATEFARDVAEGEGNLSPSK
jgi:hypothetical protein